MSIQIKITDAGRAEIINAEHNGTAPVTISQVGVGTGQYSPSASQTTLQAETKRLSTIAGQVVSNDTIHVTIKDESNDAYSVSEFGLYTASGTLFAVYSQTSGPFMQKAAQSSLLLSIDVILAALDAASLTFGDTSFSNPPASETVVGVVELATASETATGTDRTRAVHPAGLKPLLDAKAPLASPALTGTPTAPTAPANTNNTQLANTAFVAAAISALVNSSPATLDTLNELAASLGNDPNFATTITNALAQKAPLSHVGATGTAHGNASTGVAGFMSATDKSKLDGIAAGAQVNTVTSVAGRTGAVTLAKGDVGLGNVDNTADSIKSVNYASSAGNADTLDGLHAGSFLQWGDTWGSNAGNGYIRLPGGLIIQWGYVSECTGWTDYRYFPISFPNACCAVSLTYDSATPGGLGGNNGSVVQVIDTSKFLWSGAGSFGGGGYVYFIAIGY